MAITEQILTGLKHVHDKFNSVHRDIKPGNILVNTTNGLEVKIGDFGLIKSLEAFNPDQSSPYSAQKNPLKFQSPIQGALSPELLNFKLDEDDEYEFELQIEEAGA